MDNANEQAFPIPADEDHVRSRGLTKRELFAAMAMQGLLANDGNDGNYWSHMAENAVHAADALLAELAK